MANNTEMFEVHTNVSGLKSAKNSGYPNLVYSCPLNDGFSSSVAWLTQHCWLKSRRSIIRHVILAPSHVGSSHNLWDCSMILTGVGVHAHYVYSTFWLEKLDALIYSSISIFDQDHSVFQSA